MAGFDFNTPNMIGFNGMGSGNPFNDALLSMVAANNPQLIAQVASAHGIPPPTGPMQNTDNSPLGYYLTPSLNQQDPMMLGGPPPQGPTTAAAAATNPWAALSGFKGPQVSKPIMEAGVSGSQKAPEMQLGGVAGGSQQLQQLIAGLIGQLNPAGAAVRPVGGLGAYLGR